MVAHNYYVWSALWLLCICAGVCADAGKPGTDAPAGVVVAAAEKPVAEVVDDANSSTGKAATSSSAWHPLFGAPLPAEGEAFTIWVRRQGGPIQLKVNVNGKQQEKRWDWGRPSGYEWCFLGRYNRAELGQGIVIIRGGEQKTPAPRIDCVVFSTDARTHPAGMKADGGKELPPFEPDASIPAETMNVSIDWSQKAAVISQSIWGINDYELVGAKIASPRYQQFLQSLNLSLIRIHWANLADAWTNEKTRSWDVEKIKAGFAASTGYGQARLLLNIPRWPRWLNGKDGKSDALLPRENEDEFVALVGELVRIMRDVVKQPVAYWELLNETDGLYEKAGKLDDLWRLHNRLFAEIKRMDPQARVGGPAFTWAKPQWVEGFLKTCGPNVDFVTWHNYAAGDIYVSNKEVFATVGTIIKHAAYVKQAVAKAMPGKTVELFLDEYNIKWSWDPMERRHGNNIGAVFQASVLRRAALLGIDGVTVWHGKGRAYGLVDSDDTIRQTGRLYQLGARCLVGAMARETVTGGDDLEVLAVTRRDGKRSVLLINKANHTLQVRGVDASALAVPQPTVLRIDAQGFGAVEWKQVATGDQITLPGYSVTLLTADASASDLLNK